MTEIPPTQWDGAVENVFFFPDIAEMRVNAGRIFYFEDPLRAPSCRFESSMWRLISALIVKLLVLDLCAFGVTAVG